MATKENKKSNSTTEGESNHKHYSEMFDDLFGNSSDIEKKSTKKKTIKSSIVVCTNNDPRSNK